MTPIRLGVSGCCGRMGRSVVRLAAGRSEFRINLALTSPGSALVGCDAGELAGAGKLGTPVSAESGDTGCDVLVDFSRPAACVARAEWAGARGVAFVSGTTGLSSDQMARLQRLAGQVAVLWSANMSVGVALLRTLLRRAAAVLDPGEWDVEIVESHHRHKRDAPSGTAHALLRAVRDGRTGSAGRQSDDGSAAAPVDAGIRFGRDVQSPPRGPGEIGVHSLRMGGVVGDHEVHFASEGEVLTLGHRALSRDVFAAGALRAAEWLAGRPAGWYSLEDLIEPRA